MVTADEVERVLRRHVLDAWYPRSIDRGHGGFFCDFDRRWRTDGPNEKLLEFQARQTLTAADAAHRYPAEPAFLDAARHGLAYQRDVLWDREHGGWFHRLDRAGVPLEGHTKHAHGFAYAIEACAAVYQATRDDAALALARAGFEWLDEHAHDAEHGGYFGLMTRDGQVVRDVAMLPWKGDTDSLDSPLGLKDINVQSDLIETLVSLHEVWPDRRVSDRLAELVEIVTGPMMAPNGALVFFATPDWRPIPHMVRSGYQFQTAFRILTAVPIVGRAERLQADARRLVDHVLRHGRDRRRGGYNYAYPGSWPLSLNGEPLSQSYKSWWPQFEALRALLAVALQTPDERYREPFAAQWAYVRRFCLDERFGGIYAAALGTLGRVRRRLGARFAPSAVTAKGNVWKDASHDARALMYCVDALRASGPVG
jgi:mannobiose 2-epimerase